MKETNRMIENRLKRAVESETPDVLPQLLKRIKEEEGYGKMTNTIAKTISITGAKSRGIPAFPGMKSFAAIAAGLVLFFGIFFAYMNYIPQSVIGLDVNPSIELSVNRSEKVIKATALNDDALNVIGRMNLKNVDLDIAVNALIGSMVKNGYISEMKNSILITVNSRDMEKGMRLQQHLSDEVNKLLESYSVKGAVLSQTAKFDERIRQLSDQYEISPGKAALIEQFVKQDMTVEYDEVATLPINDIALLIDARHSELEGVSSSGQASSKKYIGTDKAKEQAFSHAKVSESDLRKIEVELDYEDGRMIYEVEFYLGNVKYDYEIDAIDGRILEFKLKSKDTGSNNGSGGIIDSTQTDGTGTTGATGATGTTNAAGTEATGTTGATGNEFPVRPNKPTETGNISNADPTYIGRDKATEIALAHAGITQDAVKKLKSKLDREDGRMIYEVEFIYKNMEYEYEIDALTGRIIEWEIEPEDD